jgi:hypothetical protein
MAVVGHRKCEECAKIRHIAELKDNPSGIGVVCIDKEACERERSIIKPMES